MNSEAERLRRALEHAIDVIESYELDIRNSEWIGVDLAARGFCQGMLYRDAVARVRQLADPDGCDVE